MGRPAATPQSLPFLRNCKIPSKESGQRRHRCACCPKKALGKGEVTKEIKEALKPKGYTDLSDNLDKVLGVLGVEALYLASAGLQGGSMGHKQDRVSCVKEVENIESHSSDTISFLSQTKPLMMFSFLDTRVL